MRIAPWILGMALLSGEVAAAAHAGKSATKPAAKSKESPTKPTKPVKPETPEKQDKNDLQAADRACAADFDRGDIASARRRCSDLRPSTDPIAIFWRLRLADDPNDLRRGLCASALKGVDPDARLLLLAGRYQFSRGEAKELSDLVALAGRLKLKGREIDTLRRLGAGSSGSRE